MKTPGEKLTFVLAYIRKEQFDAFDCGDAALSRYLRGLLEQLERGIDYDETGANSR